MSPSRSKTKAERRGRWGERIAALYLRLKFYRIVQQRFKTPVGEIDLVAQRGQTILFVEVKTRANASARDMALGAINRRRIARAAAYYLSRHPDIASNTLRFDLILLTPWTWPHHVKAAFESPE